MRPSDECGPKGVVSGVVSGVVRGVVLVRVPFMDIFGMLDRQLLRTSSGGIPLSWRHDRLLARYGDALALSEAVREIGEVSDALVRSMVAVSDHRELADCVIIRAAIGLVKARCRSGMIADEDFLCEVAIAVGEARRDGFPPTARHLVNVLVDRAWDRSRAEVYRGTYTVCALLDRSTHQAGSAGWDVERIALNRVAVDDLRERVCAAASASPAAVRAWNSVIELVDVPTKSRVQLDRWKYSRQQLRRHGSPDLAA